MFKILFTNSAAKFYKLIIIFKPAINIYLTM